MEPLESPPPATPATTASLGRYLFFATALLVLLVAALYLRAASRVNRVALSMAPRPVAVEKASAASFRPSRSYVGTLQPWVAARIGPQYVSAYVGTVLVRPGDPVKRGEVLGTLDCRSSSETTKAVAARARALSERQKALAHEAERMKELLAGGFTSQNEMEQLSARSSAEAAELESLRASLAGKSLEVDDCVLRAPFAGEVAERQADPGAYLRPGNSLVTVVDRSTVRAVASVPEADFSLVAPGTPVRIEIAATGKRATAPVSRRAPGADASTRTVDIEIDLPNPERSYPVGTTAALSVDAGAAQPATGVPARAATVRGDRASVFVVADGVARRTTARVLGEQEGRLYLDPAFAAGTAVVVEGRSLLEDGDRVIAREAAR